MRLRLHASLLGEQTEAGCPAVLTPLFPSLIGLVHDSPALSSRSDSDAFHPPVWLQRNSSACRHQRGHSTQQLRSSPPCEQEKVVTVRIELLQERRLPGQGCLLIHCSSHDQFAPDPSLSVDFDMARRIC